MSNKIHIGRLSFTSPGSISFSSSDGGRQLSLSGKIGGEEVTLNHIKYIRDELVSIASYGITVPFRYDGDSSYDGYVRVVQSSVNTTRYVRGGFSYSVEFEYLGRSGEIVFESRFTGALLDNDHSVTSTTNQFHAAPGNHYNYYNPSEPTDGTRLAKDETSSATGATTTLRLKTDNNLRSANSIYHVEPSDFYKGACLIKTGTYNTGFTSTNNVQTMSDTASEIRCGLFSTNKPTTLTLENGLIKIQFSTSTTQALFTSYIYDVADYQSSKDWVFSKGAPTGSNQLGNNWLGWRTMQILKNHPECATVRCTTYLNADSKDGRLVVDFTLRRGAHHVSIVANSYTSSRFNLSLDTASGTNASAGTGYIYDGTASPEDGNKWLLGSPDSAASSLQFDVAREMMYKNGSQMKAYIGYELAQENASINTSDTRDSVRDQYLDNVYEYQKLVKS
jgi:hypothetical protein